MNSKAALELFKRLMEIGIVGARGGATLSLLGVDVKMKEASAVGYLLQEWLAEWMTREGIFHESPEDSQKSPDFFLSADHSRDLLEVKAFKKNPGFDVANFEAYLDLVLDKPEHLDADYLVFEYDLVDGLLEIKNIWLKKVWEITRPMADYPLNVQSKRKVIYNIRPGDWRTGNPTFPIFASREDFLRALHGTEAKYRGIDIADAWKTKFIAKSGIRF